MLMIIEFSLVRFNINYLFFSTMAVTIKYLNLLKIKLMHITYIKKVYELKVMFPKKD